ncbi:hypothetical protein GPECTOR_1g646 [Gonium pectorale]|uniref:Uncharacterized protein n=1 Tax=Gonium pectorale TaxID=33097 RepID=A0A150H3H7_GONPE|nr:hypothetical protein GPECTOR_1g646 [Gonium pectorale]|eukprot:KXZ56717.1 hypothetical protein GPECTOR_1g646 [Gonium pectorale]
MHGTSLLFPRVGVLSGTAVVEELLLRRIQTWAAELHCLAITNPTAAERLGALCRVMGQQELQQLLVMLDQTGHPELSDFVRLMVYNTGDPTAQTVVGDLRPLREASGAKKVRQSSSRRRPPAMPSLPPRVPTPVHEDPNLLRFSTLLPEGHRLVLGAQQAAARRKQEEEEQRRAVEARAAKARAKEEGLDSDAAKEDTDAGATAGAAAGTEDSSAAADSPSRTALLPGLAPLPDFEASEMDVEEQWRRTVATRLPAESVFDTCIMLAEPLPAYEAPPDVALMRAEAEEMSASAPVRARAG